MKIQVSIDHLILEGIDISLADRPRLQAALERELSRLLASEKTPTLLRSGGSVPAIRGSELQANASTRPDVLGRQIANSVYRGLTK